MPKSVGVRFKGCPVLARGWALIFLENLYTKEVLDELIKAFIVEVVFVGE